MFIIKPLAWSRYDLTEGPKWVATGLGYRFVVYQGRLTVYAQRAQPLVERRMDNDAEAQSRAQVIWAEALLQYLEPAHPTPPERVFVLDSLDGMDSVRTGRASSDVPNVEELLQPGPLNPLDYQRALAAIDPRKFQAEYMNWPVSPPKPEHVREFVDFQAHLKVLQDAPTPVRWPESPSTPPGLDAALPDGNTKPVGNDNTHSQAPQGAD